MEPVIADEPDPTDSERERTDDESDSESARTASGGKSPERPGEPDEESVDVFDGYSFKGRHSVLIDDEDDDGHEGSDEEEDEEDVQGRIRDVEVLEPSATSGPITVDKPEDLATPHRPTTDLPVAESETESSAPSVAPSTPGPKDTGLPEPATPTMPTGDVPAPEEETVKLATPVVSPTPEISDLPPLPAEKPGELAEPTISPVSSPAPAPIPVTTQQPRTKQKREKSGIPALDRGAIDEDTEEDDWDLVEKPNGEEAAAYNGRTGAGGKQGNSLFARGVVDRYRLAVFRKSTHSGPGSARASRVVTTTQAGDVSMTPEGGVSSPTTSDSKRRGRSAGLSIRKSTKQFLRARSPPATFSAHSSSSSRAQLATMSSTISGRTAMNNGSGLLSPAPSVPAVPSLKSKSSALSGTSPASPGSSDPSIAEGSGPVASGSQSVGDLVGVALGGDDRNETETLRRKSLTAKLPAVPGSPTEEGMTKKSKKKKSGTGKMLSLFTLDGKR